MIRHSSDKAWSATRFGTGLLVGLAIVPLVVYLYFAWGWAPVSASDPQLPFEDLMTKRALKIRLEKSSSTVSPLRISEENLRSGAKIYLQHCAVCHGLPVGPVTKTASGMFPPPPQLFHGTGVTNDPVGATFWKTAYGIRLSGMPAFRNSLSETEIWQVSLLLSEAQRLPAGVMKELKPESSNEHTTSAGH